MEDKPTILEPLISKAEEFGRVSIELMEMKLLENAAELSSTIFSRTLSLLALLMCLFLVSTGLSFLLGEILGEILYGFLVVGGFYGVMGLIFYFVTHKSVKISVSNSIISKVKPEL